MATNDLVTIDGQIHDALEGYDPGATYFFRLLCGTLRELWRLFQVPDEDEAVAKLVDDLVPDAHSAYDEVRELFVRPAAPRRNPSRAPGLNCTSRTSAIAPSTTRRSAVTRP